jgi:hypothetical protein
MCVCALSARFEVPFNIWCNQCGEHIAKGVRFNAEKKQVGCTGQLAGGQNCRTSHGQPAAAQESLHCQATASELH